MASQSNREWLEEFIELYRSEPFLWNIKDKKYHDRKLKCSASTKLVEKLKTVDLSSSNSRPQFLVACFVCHGRLTAPFKLYRLIVIISRSVYDYH